MNGRPCPVPPPPPPHPCVQRVYTHTRSLAHPPARPLSRTTRYRRLPTCSRCGVRITVGDGRNAREKRVNPLPPNERPRDRQRSSTRARRWRPSRRWPTPFPSAARRRATLLACVFRVFLLETRACCLPDVAVDGLIIIVVVFVIIVITAFRSKPTSRKIRGKIFPSAVLRCSCLSSFGAHRKILPKE